MPLCPECGAEDEGEGGKFCSECGAKAGVVATSRCRKLVLHRNTLFFLLQLLLGIFWYSGGVSEKVHWCGVNESSEIEVNEIITGVSGKIFSGESFRKFANEEYKFGKFTGSKARVATEKDCAQWAVVTTINAPTTSVLRVAALPDWCLVVVGDKKTPPFVLPPKSNSHFLGLVEQASLGEQFPEFFAKIPYNHFGRKNLGYIFAIIHGAKKVWDFDDDNNLLEGGSIPNPESAQIKQVQVNTSCAVFNPYPQMGGPGTKNMPSWPRGLPLDLILHPCPTSESISKVPVSKIAVVQSLANHDPDVDAIYRLSRGTPFDFQGNSKDWYLLSKGALSPYNAQATLILESALWSLMLPVTVHGRVSDIWRSYISQRLFWDIGMHLTFAPPHVDQFRNVHNYMGDLKAEEPLYSQATALTQFLRDWRGIANSLPGRLEELTVAMYERGYLELGDVKFAQLWIESLIKAGYQFPPLV